MWVIDDCLDKCLIARKHVWKKDRAINPKDRPLIRLRGARAAAAQRRRKHSMKEIELEIEELEERIAPSAIGNPVPNGARPQPR